MSFKYPASTEAFKELLGQQRVKRGTTVIEQQVDENGIRLGEGRRPGFALEKTETTVVGAAGSIIESAITVTGTCIVSNAMLHCDANTPAVTVESGGYCILSGCHITKKAGIQGATDRYVHVKTGGRAVVVGCFFHNAQPAGWAVDNDDAGNPGRAMVTGCVNLTGRVSQNATIQQEVT